jgi:hypothetical protein
MEVMALLPPADFSPPPSERVEPSEDELRLLWRARERARLERGRVVAWRGAVEELRRGSRGDLRTASPEATIPAFAREPGTFGPDSRASLRPVPRSGRVMEVGIDTISVGWYAEPTSKVARALTGLADFRARGAVLLSERVGGFRVGWFPASGLVFAEGHPSPGRLCSCDELPGALGRLDDELWDVGIPVAEVPSAGVRRLDVSADVEFDSAPEGLGLLECVAGASFGSGRLAGYRSGRCLETVVVRSPGGRSLARIYDKGFQLDRARERGRRLRLEAQWRFPHGARPTLEGLDGEALRERFKRRFRPIWQAAGGFSLGGPELLVERVAEAVRSGQLRPSRARSVVGYLMLRSAGVDQGAYRTVAELERECRELGLAVSMLESEGRRFDVASVLDECLQPGMWG